MQPSIRWLGARAAEAVVSDTSRRPAHTANGGYPWGPCYLLQDQNCLSRTATPDYQSEPRGQGVGRSVSPANDRSRFLTACSPRERTQSAHSAVRYAHAIRSKSQTCRWICTLHTLPCLVGSLLRETAGVTRSRIASVISTSCNTLSRGCWVQSASTLGRYRSVTDSLCPLRVVFKAKAWSVRSTSATCRSSPSLLFVADGRNVGWS